ncbi:hypothetical protein LIER_13115 [Lithospermum erythrorhizon]|uniref:Uncharacterized protein n=1 Tax=Lithospermum erythrorhizon TaxID=34254 RepID=A0AAV3PWE5_LITER
MKKRVRELLNMVMWGILAKIHWSGDLALSFCHISFRTEHSRNPFLYFPLYSLPYHDFAFPMVGDAPTNVAGFTNIVLGTVQSILREESGTGSRPTPPSGGRDHEAETFAASVITDPDAGATKTSQGGHVAVETVHLSKKRKRATTKKTSGKVLSLNLFSRIFNLAHTGVLLHFHTRSQMKNMLCHGKPGKASPTRWHKYWFLAKDAFSDEVRYSFSTVPTTLEYEETPELAEGLKKLEDGFHETITMDVFYDPDVLIKPGLSKGSDNFPGVELGIFLPFSFLYTFIISALFSEPFFLSSSFFFNDPFEAQGWESRRPPPGELLGGDLGNRLLSEMLAPEPSPSSTPTLTVGVSSQSRDPEERSSPLLPTPTPADQPAINLEVLSPELSPIREVPLFPARPHIVPTSNINEGSSTSPENFAGWTSRERGFENKHPFFVDLPYTLPSGLQITRDTVSTPTASLAAEMLKNCLPRPSVLGVLGTPPSSLFDRFSYHHIKTMEVAYALSLRLNASSEHDEEVALLKAALVSVEKEMDEAISKRDELAALCSKQCEMLLTDAREASEVYRSEGERLKQHCQHIRELQSQVEDLNFNFSESQDMVRGFTNKCGDTEVQIADLQRALDDSIEGFKRSEKYRTLLKGDTATLLGSFCQRMAKDYPGISSHFTNFVTCLGEGYVVSLFDELPEEEPAESDDESESDTIEEELGDES